MLFYELSQELQILCCIGILLWMTGTIYLLLRTFRANVSQIQRLYISICCIIAVCIFQGVSDAAGYVSLTSDYSPLAQIVRTIPVVVLFTGMVMLCGSELFYALHLYRISQHQLSPDCVKESMDALPDGIAFATETGTLLLANLKMQQLCAQLTGGSLMNLHHFWDKLLLHSQCYTAQETADDMLVIETPDGIIWNFQKKNCILERKTVIELTACDVTTQYHLQQELKRRNSKLLAVNQRLRRLEQDVERVTREQELLDAKMKLHDNLGKMLLVYRSYERHQPSQQDRKKLLSLWKQTISILKQEGTAGNETDWSALLQTAQHLGVEIQLEGQLPVNRSIQELFISAVKETLTNTVKHAGGNILYITVSEPASSYITIRICNNGATPDQTIIESGGLANLRKNIEQAGGIMVIDSLPAFQITLKLPEYKE